MKVNDDYLKKCLLEISGIVDDSLTKNDSQQLLELQNWLTQNFQKIQLHQNEYAPFSENPAKELRKDALFIFDIDFRIISYTGTHNIFGGSVINQEANLLDIINEDYKPHLKAAVAKAIENRENIIVDLYVKNNINIVTPCTFELDMVSSNPDNNRFVGSLSFLGMLASDFIEYQSFIFNNLPGVGVYLLDRNFKYLFAGGKEKERFDMNNNQFIGQSLFNVLEKKAVRLVYPFILQALQGNETEGEIRYENDIYSLKASPVKNFNNDTVAAILFSQNITNQKVLEEQMQQSKDEAMNSDRLKSIFIANISHEIRTPLNIIMGFTEQLQKTILNAEQEKFIKLIHKSSEHLLYLVTEIIFLFKLGMGKVYIENTPFSIMDLLTELRDIFQQQASEKNLALEFNIDETLPHTLMGDSFRLRQILMNLLVNAIKYTNKGFVTMNCRVKKNDKKKVELDFEIKDTGVGISEKNLQNIFKVFEQGNKLQANSRAGAGLGLGICKNLVELLGGKISVTSKVDVGSTFTVSLTFDKASSLQKPPRKDIKYNLNSNSNLLAGKRILLAEDDEHTLMLVDNILKSWKTDYLLVDNGQKAIDLLAQNKFDIAIVDIYMPEKNGLDVMKFVRSNKRESNYNTPFIFVTANAIKSDISDYMKAGFNGYLIKPFREEELFNKLCNILRLVPVTENHQISEEQVPYNKMTDIFDTKELRRTAKGDPIFFEKMISNFIINANNLIEILNSEKSLETWRDIGNDAHKLTPSFKYFGLSEIVALLQRIEDYTLRNKDYSLASGIIDELIMQIRISINQAKSALEN